MVECGDLADPSTMTTATTPTPEPPEATPSSRRLTRSSSDRVIAGVAGGLGRYFSIDPVVIRIAFIVGAFFGGAGLIAYGAAWLLVPSDDGKARAGAAGVARRLGIAVGLIVLVFVAMVAGFFGVSSGGETTVAIIVLVAGGLLVVGAFTGGMRWLILPALAFALTGAAAAAGNIDTRGGTGERVYRPATAEDLRSDYKLGMGHLLLDLRNTKFGPGNHTVHLKVGLGQAEVLVPPNVCVSSTAHISGGATNVFQHDTGGTYHDWEEIRQPKGDAARLTVDADIGFGELRIQPGVGYTGTQEGACVNG